MDLNTALFCMLNYYYFDKYLSIRLCVPTRLVTSIGNDANASVILKHCEKYIIDVSFSKIKDEPTPFSYVLVY